MPLTAMQIRSLKAEQKPRKYSDGGGLHLLVTSQGSRLWRLAYRFGGKQKLMALGSYPAVSLSDARAKRFSARQLLANDIDPGEQAKAEKSAAKAEYENSFRTIAAELLEKDRREGKSDVTLGKKQWLVGLADPDIGSKPVTHLKTKDILVPLRRVESQGNYETARRLRAVIGQVFRYAIATGRADYDPTYGLKGALVAPKAVHMAAITEWAAYAGLIRKVWNYSGSPETRAALKLMALLYPRPGELRKAEWSEFDLDNAIWVIPAERMKMRKAHKKPLPALAVSILDDLRELTGNQGLVFPTSNNPNKPLSENTMNAALRRMDFAKEEMTSHGFRASASTFLNESGLWSSDAIEAELSHARAGEVRRAYHRGQHWEERLKMADWWTGEIERCALEAR